MLPSLICNKCGKEKNRKLFYKIYSGYRVKTCNECYKKINRERNKEIARRKKAAKWF